MNTLKKIISILSENKWDYAKLAQITSVLGGAKKAVLKYSLFSAVISITVWESLKSFLKKMQNKLDKQTKKDQDEINKRTESYLSERKKLIESGQSADTLDKKYNEFMETALGSLTETD